MINLIPLSQKEELKTDRAFAIVNLLGMVAALVLVSFALAILAIGYYFDGKLGVKTIEAEGIAKQLSMMDAANLDKEMSEYGAQCKKLNNFYAQMVSPADVAKLVADNLPPGIELRSLSISAKTIGIDGVSENREDLVKMRDNLQKTPHFKNVNIPPSSWVAQENNSFNATIDYDFGK